MKVLRQNPLFLVFLVPVIVDVTGTVLGQSADYWTSGFQRFNEAAPVFPLLQIHPLVFIIGTLLIWLSFTYWLVKKLKEPLNLWATMALFAGHSYNSVFWFRKAQSNLGILTSTDRLSITLSLIPMFVYILLIGLIASIAISNYYSKSHSL